MLGTMLYRYISENLTNYINAGEQAAGNPDFDYAKMSDAEAEEAREGLVEDDEKNNKTCRNNTVPLQLQI